ncbi:hypothetical protein RUM43_014366 [Polyplax serrata]|uniref:Transmembrane protein 53 n=1 Tax=Polyplax serrata TaxID=468196 RepID=A0AAN8S2L8_POLSC
MADLLDELKFQLKFPLSTARDRMTDREKDDFIFIYDEEKLPVIVLFGWTGCQDKYLSKYSAIYEERGCIAPVTVTLLRHDKFPRLSEKVMDIIQGVSLDKHPIFFHIFSNGGAFFYQHLSRLMQKKNIILHVRGVIFDSAPGEKRFYSVYRALTAILGGSPWYNIPVGFSIAVFLFIVFLFVAFIKGLLEFKKPQMDPLKLIDEPYNWPQLFIYSKDDELVRYQDVEKFASKREQNGVKIKRLCFDNSPHVQHLVSHREIYINTVTNFLQECLTSNATE